MLDKATILAGLIGYTLSATASPAGYTVVDLGPDQLPTEINAAGTIAGGTGSYPYHGNAEVYQDGQWSALDAKSKKSFGNAINRKGEIVGDDGHRPVRWVNGQRESLAGVPHGRAEGISKDGTIVGSTDPKGFGSGSCYSWKSGVVTDLGSLGGSWCDATSISSSGQYIGGFSANGHGWHAFIRDAGGMHDLGTLAGALSEDTSVNRHGHASLSSNYDETTNNFAATYWNGKRLIQVPGVTPAGMTSWAGRINDADEMLVLGYDAQNHPAIFLYEGRTGVTTAIEPLIRNPTGWDFSWYIKGGILRGIGDDGTIVGQAPYNGVPHGFMLVPDAQ